MFRKAGLSCKPGYKIISLQVVLVGWEIGAEEQLDGSDA